MSWTGVMVFRMGSVTDAVPETVMVLTRVVSHPFQPAATPTPRWMITVWAAALDCVLNAETSAETSTMPGSPPLIFSDTFSERLHVSVCAVLVPVSDSAGALWLQLYRTSPKTAGGPSLLTIV